MKITGYPLATPSWDKEENEVLQEIISGGMFSMGKHVQKFENDFSSYIGSKYSVMVSSGSTANLLMTAALFLKKISPLKAGDEIIVPAVSWSTTYFPLQQYGLRLKFVDIDGDTLNYDTAQLKAAVSNQTKAIMSVNLLGNSNDYTEINQLIKKHGLYLLEDNCESLGGSYNGKKLGTFGHVGSFSFFFSHHMSTMEGGMVVTDDEEIYHILLSIRAHGWTRDLPKENTLTELSDDPFIESFNFILPGYNARPLEMSGALGSSQLKKLNGFVTVRRKNADTINDLFLDHPYLKLQKETGQSSWFGFALTLTPDAPISRASLVSKMKGSNIECRPVVAGNFTRHKVITHFDYEIHETLSAANWLHENSLFTGNHPIDIRPQLELLKNICS